MNNDSLTFEDYRDALRAVRDIIQEAQDSGDFEQKDIDYMVTTFSEAFISSVSTHEAQEITTDGAGLETLERFSAYIEMMKKIPETKTALAQRIVARAAESLAEPVYPPNTYANRVTKEAIATVEYNAAMAALRALGKERDFALPQPVSVGRQL